MCDIPESRLIISEPITKPVKEIHSARISLLREDLERNVTVSWVSIYTVKLSYMFFIYVPLAGITSRGSKKVLYPKGTPTHELGLEILKATSSQRAWAHHQPW